MLLYVIKKFDRNRAFDIWEVGDGSCVSNRLMSVSVRIAPGRFVMDTDNVGHM